MKKLMNIGAIILMAALAACNSASHKTENGDSTTTETKADASNPMLDEKFVGSWVEPIPGNEKEVQGFELQKDGSAKSINMATLTYQKWWSKSDTLYLVALSTGNHESAVDTAAYKVENITKDAMTLKDRELTLNYKRQ